MSNNTAVTVGLYGMNGHQVHRRLVKHPRARLTAVAAIDRASLPPALAADASVTSHETLAQLLSNPAVDLVVLCSPRRSDQAADAIAALEAGKHVYAEKPAAMTFEALDEILDAARRTGRQFHEMAGTAFEHPSLAIRNLILRGVLGTVVQVVARKSYPYHDGRPQDENVDGGITLQAAIHAVRFIEHAACTRVTHVSAVETLLGNPVAGGGLTMASSMMMRLANGGVATANSNYLNPRGIGSWGNDGLQVFGTAGMVEFQLAGNTSRLILGDRDTGPLDLSEPSSDYFDCLINSLLDGSPMPVSLEEELHPTRVVIRARESARQGSGFLSVD